MGSKQEENAHRPESSASFKFVKVFQSWALYYFPAARKSGCIRCKCTCHLRTNQCSKKSWCCGHVVQLHQMGMVNYLVPEWVQWLHFLKLLRKRNEVISFPSNILSYIPIGGTSSTTSVLLLATEKLLWNKWTWNAPQKGNSTSSEDKSFSHLFQLLKPHQSVIS